MTTVAEAWVTLRPQTTGFQQEAERGVAGPLKSLAAGVAGAFAAVQVKDFIGGAVGEAREAIKVTAQTAQVIKSTGGAAGVTAKQFESLANAISKKVGIDDEAIQSAENLLATFTNVRNETGDGAKVFDIATQAIVDMSAVQGELQSNALLVGKALQDPVLGMTALQRVGVRLSATQKQQIKDFAAVGDKASAQQVILKELGVEFGGQAAAQATAGQKLSVAWGNVQETVGTKLIPVMEKVSVFLVEHQNLIGPVAIVIGTVLVAAFTAWAISAAAAAAATLAAAAPVIGIGVAIAALAAGIIYAYTHFRVFRTIVDGVFKAARIAVGLFISAVGPVLSFFKENWGLILAPLTGGLSLLIQHFSRVRDIVKHVIEWLKKIPGVVDKALGPLDEIAGKAAGLVGGTVGKVGGLIGKLPGFDVGGVVPGQIGQPMLAVVHGGEEVLTPAQRGQRSYSIGELHVHTKDDPQRIQIAAADALRNAAFLMGA